MDIIARLNDDLRGEVWEYIGISEQDKDKKARVVHHIKTMKLNSAFYCHLDGDGEELDRMRYLEERTSVTMYVIPVHHFPDWHNSLFAMSPTDLGIEQDLEPFIIVH
jgi:hypothetical protein